MGEMLMRVTVVGLGYVGLVTAACLAEWDHEVVGIDANPERLDALRDGRMPFHEPRLPEIVAEGVATGRLSFAGDLPSAAADADLVIVAVGTHDGNGGWQTDTVRACLADLVPAMADGAVLVIRSTLPPDFIRQLPSLIGSRRAAVDRGPLAVLLNPEFTREGRAVRDFQSPDRVVLGIVSDPAGSGEAALRDLYRNARAPIVVMGAIDAAITKLGANLFLATKISFANELGEICDAFGADVATVVDGMSYDARIGGAFLKAGVGFGGSCLPNQVSMTIRTAAQAGVATPLLTAVDEVNHRRRTQVVERAAALLDGTVRHRRVALLGLTFKPDTDDLRDAPALTIAKGLIDDGADVVAYDPMPTARERASGIVDGLQVVDTAVEAIAGADLVILVTEWPEFLDIDWDAAGRMMRRRVVIDGRNVLSGEQLAASGFSYASFGRGSLLPRDEISNGLVPSLSRQGALRWGEG
jgi:UDPglucose 6-dehydrogenase